ncbi:hypothetical protein GBA52_013995, partial [Prunus armeniaca]
MRNWVGKRRVNKGQQSWPLADGGRPTVVVASGRGRWRPATGGGGRWAVGDGQRLRLWAPPAYSGGWPDVDIDI